MIWARDQVRASRSERGPLDAAGGDASSSFDRYRDRNVTAQRRHLDIAHAQAYR